MGILLGLVIFAGCLAFYAAIVLGFDYLLFLAYNHFADKFHWAHLSFWEVVVAVLVIGFVADMFRPKVEAKE